MQLRVTAPPPVGHDACAVTAGQLALVVTVTGPTVTASPACRGGAMLARALYCAPALMPANCADTRSVRPSHTIVLVCGAARRR